jgi:hypothetical protein
MPFTKTIAECWEDARWNSIEKVDLDKPAIIRVAARVGETALIYGMSYRHEAWRNFPLLRDLEDSVDEEQLIERYQQWRVEELEKQDPKE